MNTIAIIPARFASTRFPGKPLALLDGRPIIEHVYEQVRKVIDTVYVATDDERIFQTVEAFGGKAVMTSSHHQSGTDRIAEAVRNIAIPCDVVVNVQGDEPFIHPSQIETLCACFDDAHTQIATLGIPFTDMAALENPNSPKIVRSEQGFALYFSRSVVPFIRGEEREHWLQSFTFLKHIGIYAYRAEVLQAVTRLTPSPLERAESLEQLRWLEHGYKIKVGLTDISTIGIDTPEDLKMAEQLIMLKR